ncbi:MAG: NYN domain-containing protein [Butyrivibrio sp.]|nr:NYN domain-containing protein [Butyrivibrio sp.]
MKKHLTLGILAHVDAGKTTLSEGLLYLSGAIRNIGRVDHKDTFLDTYELERARGITIFSKQALFEYEDSSFTLLDTPGHADFSPEMERTLQVLDMAVLLISVPDGVTSQVKLLWKLLDHYRVPVMIFVNKMDQVEDSPEHTKEAILASLKENLSSHVVSFDKEFDDSDFQEELAICNDELLEGYLEGKEISMETARLLIKERECFPCLFGSALKMEGVKELLDTISEYSEGYRDDGNEGFGGRVFKISRDANGTRLTHLKITSGSLKIRDTVQDEKIDQIRLYSGDKFTPMQEATTGMICAVTGLSGTRAGEGLGVLKGSSVSEVLQPILSSTLILPEEADITVVFRQLQLLQEEEPMLLVSKNEVTGELEVQVMGEVQKEILKHLIKSRFDLDVKFGPGRIVYKETIASPAEGIGHYEPLRHYAEVHLLLEPAEPGSGITVETSCSTDELALNWQRLIMTHVMEKKHLGVLTGSEITDIKITLLTGRAHEKHTEGGDFRQATYRAIRQGLMMADSVLLEPMYDLRIEAPQEFVGRALTDLQRMNGKVDPPEIEGNKSVITGSVPAACLGDYAVELSGYTHGEGKLFVTLSGYAPCHNSEEIIESIGYNPTLDVANSPDSVFCSHGAGTVIPWDRVREHMHVDSGWDSKTGTIVTDLTDNIDMEALKELQNRLKRKKEPERSFADVERDLRMTENELKDIFERTYGTIKPRYVAAPETFDSSFAEEKEARRDLAVEQEKRAKYENTRTVSETDAMKEYLLVDGYNVIYASKELSDLAARDLKAARDTLIDTLVNFQGFRREKVLLVFDAYKVPGGREHVEEKSGLMIIYTKEAETADQYIEKAAHEISRKYRVTVATSDAIEQVIVMGSGAIRLSARDFWEEIRRTGDLIREKIGK